VNTQPPGVPPPPPPARSAMPPPVPPPVPRPIPPPPLPPWVASSGAAQKSKRGLYMAAGSLATLAVLIAVAVEGPKFLHGGSTAASEPAPPAASAPAPATPNPSPAATDPAVSATPGDPPKTQSAWTPVGQSPAAVSSQAAPPPVNAAPASQQAPAPEQSAPQSAAPQSAAPQSAAAQPPRESQNPPAPAPANREYAQLRQQLNELTVRANSASTGLQSFQQQQSRQGLGLRADIREAKTRLDYQLQEAMSSAQSGDLEAARQSLRYAQSAVETIEKFLGR
jgi:hypothetical protein